MNVQPRSLVSGAALRCRKETEDLAAVEIQGMWGYINKQVRYIIYTDFYNVWPFTNDLAQVVLKPNCQYTTPQGTFTFDQLTNSTLRRKIFFRLASNFTSLFRLYR